MVLNNAIILMGSVVMIARFADGRYKHRAVVPNILFFEPEKGLLSILSRYNFTIEENSPEEQQVALDPELLGKVFENLLGAYNPETKETARNQSAHSIHHVRLSIIWLMKVSLPIWVTMTLFVHFSLMISLLTKQRVMNI